MEARSRVEMKVEHSFAWNLDWISGSESKSESQSESESRSQLRQSGLDWASGSKMRFAMSLASIVNGVAHSNIAYVSANPIFGGD